MPHHTTPSQKRRRRYLYEQHPYCYWCGVLLDPPYYAPSIYAASIDHVYPRQVKKTRGNIKEGEVTVLACSLCNLWRNHMQQREGKKWKPMKSLIALTGTLSRPGARASK